MTNWNGRPSSATPSVVPSAIGDVVTVVGGFLGWTLVQDYYVGVHLVPSRNSPSPPSSTT